MASLEQRLAYLERVEAARTIGARYARACDAKSVPTLRSDVFTHDVVLYIPGGEFSGIDAVGEFYQGAFDAEPGARRHFVVNQIIEPLDGEELQVDSYFLFVSADQASVIGWGTYRDVVAFDSGSPRIREKSITLDVQTTIDDGWASEPETGTS